VFCSCPWDALATAEAKRRIHASTPWFPGRCGEGRLCEEFAEMISRHDRGRVAEGPRPSAEGPGPVPGGGGLGGVGRRCGVGRGFVVTAGDRDRGAGPSGRLYGTPTGIGARWWPRRRDAGFCWWRWTVLFLARSRRCQRAGRFMTIKKKKKPGSLFIFGGISAGGP